MTADAIAGILIGLAAIPATLYWGLYTFTAPWFRHTVGRALWVKATSLMLLCDISLAYQIFGNDYPWRDAVRLTVYVLVVTGLWYQLVALIDEKRKGSRKP